MVTPGGSRSGLKLPLGRLYKIRPCSSSADVIAYLRGGRDLRADRNLWSGRRVAEFGSNPVSSGLPLVPFRNKKFKECRNIRENGAEGQNRTADTMIFSHVLYRLSYLGLFCSAEQYRT